MSRFASFVVVLAAMLAPLAPAIATRPADPAVTSSYEDVKAMRVEGRLQIAPDGSVASASIATPMTPELRAALESRARGWEFVPVLREGQPAIAEALMILDLVARQQPGSEGFTIQIASAWFDDPARIEERRRLGWPLENASARIRQDGPLDGPQYPRQLQSLGVEGKVMVAVRVDAEGRVAEAVAVQSMLVDARGRDRAVGAALRQFEQSALSGARQWRFIVEPRGPLTPANMTVTVPVWYSLRTHITEHGSTGAWERQLRTPERPLPWIPKDQAQRSFGLATATAGAMRQLDPPIRLRRDVAGTML
jgi:TonB family protein